MALYSGIGLKSRSKVGLDHDLVVFVEFGIVDFWKERRWRRCDLTLKPTYTVWHTAPL